MLTTDHGRGDGAEWTDHGKDVTGAGGAWIAVLGPDTPPTGVRVNTPARQGQVAATIAALLGKDWVRAEPRAAAPLPVFRSERRRGAVRGPSRRLPAARP